ncbi:protein adenylyltransferase SelO-like [Antedon mediterranea]|uniref:protein adenylyltransferase SelO-like n=1 Tax=Antedon mediterranea TaxID=105859 RepID=UPI003AF7A277
MMKISFPKGGLQTNIFTLVFISCIYCSLTNENNEGKFCLKADDSTETCSQEKTSHQRLHTVSECAGGLGLELPLFTSFGDWVLNVKPCKSVRENFPIDSIDKNYVRQVKNVLFSKVQPTPLKTQTQVVAVSEDVMEKILDLDPEVAKEEFFRAFVSGNTVLQHVPPLVHRYGGHQFGSWAGQLGDGRAHLLGEYTNRNNETWELQLKGSGLTPYSRRGDGRAVLRSSVREFLCSEAMHYLNIPTSRALSLLVSTDPVIRDQFYNGNPKQERAAVVLRLAPTWFRFGSLEILASSGEKHLLKKLVDFIIVQYFQDIDILDADKYLMFYYNVVKMTADMIARWQSVGFAHGVMNTDNFSILSLTIDYGPFGFLDDYNPKFVPNYSDDEARYSFENQPLVAHYNLKKLEKALQVLLPPAQHNTLSEISSYFIDIYKSKWIAINRQKLGLIDEYHDQDIKLINILYKMMEDNKADFTMTFRQMSSLTFNDIVSVSIPEGLWALEQIEKHEDFEEWMILYAERIKLNGVQDDDKKRQKRMNNINPRYILRNWIAQAAISKAEKDDFSDVQLLARVLKNPFQEQEVAEVKGWASRPPSWASKIKVSCSS